MRALIQSSSRVTRSSSLVIILIHYSGGGPSRTMITIQQSKHNNLKLGHHHPHSRFIQIPQIKHGKSNFILSISHRSQSSISCKSANLGEFQNLNPSIQQFKSSARTSSSNGLSSCDEIQAHGRMKLLMKSTSSTQVVGCELQILTHELLKKRHFTLDQSRFLKLKP